MTAARSGCVAIALIAGLTVAGGSPAAGPAGSTKIATVALPSEADAVTPLVKRWNLRAEPIAVDDVNGDGLGEIAQLDLRSFSNRLGRLQDGLPLTVRLSIYLSPLRAGRRPAVAGFRAHVNQTAKRGRFGGAMVVPDISGDRVPDVVVTDPLWPGGRRRAGAGVAWVIFGRLDGEAVTTPETPGWGYEISGAGRRAFLGGDLAGGRDVNGDGIGDLVLSAAHGPFGTARGEAYVVFGKATADDVDLGEPGPWGYVVTGVAGPEVELTGDMTGDGRAEVLVPKSTPKYTPPLVVVPGKTSPEDVDTADALLTIAGGAEPEMADSGDVNNDGFADLVLADEWAGTSPTAVPSRNFPRAQAALLQSALTPGTVSVVFGGSSRRRVHLEHLRVSDGHTVHGASTPDMLDSASVAGDFNADGYQDLIVRARRGGRYCRPNGAAYVVLLEAGTRSIWLDHPKGRALRIDGAKNMGRLIQLPAGDVDGDQHADAVLYAGGAGTARIYKIAGSSSLPPAADHTPPRAKLVLERNREQSFRRILRRGYVRVAVTLSERARVRVRVALTGPKRHYRNLLSSERSLKAGRTQDVRLVLDRRARRRLRAGSADLRAAWRRELAAFERNDNPTGRGTSLSSSPSSFPESILTARAELVDNAGNRCSAGSGIHGSIYLFPHGPIAR